MPAANAFGEFRQRHMPRPLPPPDAQVLLVYPEVAYDVPNTRRFYCALVVASVVAVPSLATYVIVERDFCFAPWRVVALLVTAVIAVMTWVRNLFSYNRATWPPGRVQLQALVFRVGVWTPVFWGHYAQINRGESVGFATAAYSYFLWAISDTAILNDSWGLTRQQLLGMPIGLSTELLWSLMNFCFNYGS